MDSAEERIALPPNSRYSSYEEALHALRDHGMQNGYGCVLKHSKPYGSMIKTRYYYRCDRSGKYTSQATIRKTSTRAAGCPFNLIIFNHDEQWQLEVKHGYHNHPPSLNPSAHHVYRRRTQAQKESIESMTKAGVAPKQILTAIRQKDPDTLITAHDIRNERSAARANALGTRTPVEALLDELSSDEWVFDVKKDSTNRIQHLFFAHRKQVELLHANPDILLMDCTYRTNKYRLPLLHILGCTNLQSFFSAGFCFLRTETQQDYQWAISTFIAKTRMPLPRIFISDQEDALKSAILWLLPSIPQLLCIWHVNKNVQTKAQQVWRDANCGSREEKQKTIEMRERFMSRWNQVSCTINKKKYKQALNAPIGYIR